jgi:hypothetical protein
VTAGRHGLLARKSHLWVSVVGLRASLGYVCGFASCCSSLATS